MKNQAEAEEMILGTRLLSLKKRNKQQSAMQMNRISVSNKMLFNFVFSFYDVTHLPPPMIFPNKYLSKKKVESLYIVA